jgi:hypothetical protein
MSDEQDVPVGSETPSETVETPVETPSSETPAAEVAAEQKAGDACNCPDGRPGTLHDQEGTLVCLANQG